MKQGYYITIHPHVSCISCLQMMRSRKQGLCWWVFHSTSYDWTETIIAHQPERMSFGILGITFTMFFVTLRWSCFDLSRCHIAEALFFSKCSWWFPHSLILCKICGFAHYSRVSLFPFNVTFRIWSYTPFSIMPTRSLDYISL